MTGNTDVVVIGGGYAGVMTANRLTQRDDVTVTLINPRPSHVDARRPRKVVSPSEIRAVLESFQRALETRNPQDLLDVLAPDVVLVSDGGGIKRAALRPVVGAGKVVRFYLGGSGKVDGTITGHPTLVNGSPALVVRLDGEIDGVMAIRVEDARITGLYYVRNPEKLTRVESETPLTLR